MIQVMRFLLLFITLLFLSSCGEAGISDSNTTQKSATPISNPGEDYNVTINSVVQLDGSSSVDLNGNDLNYSWSIISKPEGSTATLSNSTVVNPTFTVDKVGVYVVKLSVSDATIEDAVSSLIKIYADSTPIANAGEDQHINTLSLVTLDASASVVSQGETLTYKWTLVSKPSSSTAILSATNVVKPTFTPDIDGVYEFSLLVSNGRVESEPDSVIVTATRKNALPVAEAGENQNIKKLTTVLLDGSKSSDADGDLLTYKWILASKPTKSKATLSDATIVNPSFFADMAGTYQVDLVVNDTITDSVSSRVTIVASDFNSIPIANAGTNQNVYKDAIVHLNAAASYDADSDSLTYSWSMTSKPELSQALLSDNSSVNPTFIADRVGSYVFSLIVSDGKVKSDYAYVTINAAVKNIAPVAHAGLNQNVKTLSLVTLDGSVSSDANLDSLEYKWTMVSQPQESTAKLSDNTIVNPSFYADKDGAYVFQLIVSDSKLSSDAKYVTINASTKNAIPVANAGKDQYVTTLSTTMLNASRSYDVDANTLTYIWNIVSKPTLSTAHLSDTSLVNPTFVPDVDGTYVFQLVVNDSITNSLSDTVSVIAVTTNSAPVAIIGQNQNVITGESVIVDGSLSSDADHDPLSYSWKIVSRPNGSSADLTNKTIVNPTFVPDVDGSYVIALSVNDAIVESPLTYTTIVASKLNSKPIASAGNNQNVTKLSVVTLNALGSSDADGDTLRYRWRMISYPTSSTAQLSSTTTAQPSLRPDKIGTYVFELVVNDGHINSEADYVRIDVN